MKFIRLIFGVFFIVFSAQAEVIETDDDALAIFGTACEPLKDNEPSASIRLRAADKACYAAVSSLPEIVDIKDSFDDHDFNVMIYNIVDDYIEDMSTKTIKQDSKQLCIEVSGYITPDNIGKAIDKTVQMASEETVSVPEVSSSSAVALIDIASTSSSPNLISSESANQSFAESENTVISTIFIKPTQFYNDTQSSSHSQILKNILSQSENVQIVNHEDDANFVITPKVLKAKIEPINSKTSRMQMVINIETFDRNQNESTSEHQNKFILFNNEDDEQVIAKDLLRDLFEKGSQAVIKLADKSNHKILQTQKNSTLLSDRSTHSATTILAAGAVATDK